MSYVPSFSANIHDPLVLGGNFLHSVSPIFTTYAHEKHAIGGYWSSSFSFNENPQYIDSWIVFGLGRHVETFDETNSTIFEGFANKITIVQGPFRFEIGPLLDIANSIRVAYTPKSTGISPPVSGTRTITSAVVNTISQGLYGAIEKIIPGDNAINNTDAIAVANKFLTDPGGAFPATSQNSSAATGSGTPQITLDIQGYWHLLKTFYPIDTTVADIARSTKIQNVLSANPNAGIFSADFNGIATNNTLIAQQMSGEESAETILLNINSAGLNSLRTDIGFYKNRKLYYDTVKTEIAYEITVKDNRTITDRAGQSLMPWNVEPAQWSFAKDVLPGKFIPITLAQLQADPRAGYIESVRFDAPYSFSVNGIKYNTMAEFQDMIGLTNGGV